ncbi:alpha/beta hydrolase [Thalassotalea ganghwensis]
MKFPQVYKALIFTSSFTLSGCSTIVSSFIEESNSFDYLNVASDEDIEHYGFGNGYFCSDSQGVCISYLEAKSLNTSKLRYTTEIDSNGQETTVSLEIRKASLTRDFKGTVVLLHGFRASKEFMINSALFFRFLGFDVLIPDLLGHGKSSGEKSYGVGDAPVINELIDYRIAAGKRLFILGNSMGSLTAAYLSDMRNDVSGVILQAPMLEFDQAVSNYINANLPLASYLFSQQNIEQGAISSLRKADLSLGKTNIKPLIMTSNTPMIIIASESDTVAPYSYFKELASDKVKTVKVQDRNHPSMAVIGNSESHEVIKWLSETVEINNTN